MKRLFAAPGRPSLVAAALALAAAAAAQAHLTTYLRAPLGYLLMGVIPGWLLAESVLRSEGTTAEELAMASLVLALPVTLAGRTLAFACGLPAPMFPWAWAALCALWALLLRPRARALPPADRVVWWTAAAFALLVALPATLNLVIRVYGDSISHVQIVNEIRLRGIPPQDPSNAGMPLTYPWQFHVWAAALVEAMGITPFGIFPWVGGAMLAALAFGAYRLASLFWTGTLARRIAPAVVVLGMNALGWALMAAMVLRPLVLGRSERLHHILSVWIVHPFADQACGSLVPGPLMVLCSLLFKFFVASTIGTALAMTVAALALAAARLREDGRRDLPLIAVLAMAGALVHPLVGVPADLALLAGLALAALAAEGRGRAIASALAVAAGLALSLPVVAYMLHLGLGGPAGGGHAWIQLNRFNVLPLATGIVVVSLPAAWGWNLVRERSRPLAALGLGFALAAIALALFLSPPVARTEAYLVYVAYLGVALFAGAGVGALVAAGSRRFGAPLAWALAALVFLPNALVLFNGFARQDASWGLAGYPETRDEIAVFDFLRDHTPVDAVAVDLQALYSSSVAAYAARRGYFGGNNPAVAAQVGQATSELVERGRVVSNLLLEPALRDSTLLALHRVPAPLYVVARRKPPVSLNVAALPDPRIDPIARLDSLPSGFEPVLRTPTIVLYRLRRGAGDAWPPAAAPAEENR